MDKEAIIKGIKEIKAATNISFANLSKRINIARSTLHDMFKNGKMPVKINWEELSEKLIGFRGEIKRRNILKKGDIMEALTFEAMERFGLDKDPFRNEIDSRGDIYINNEIKRLKTEIEIAIKRKRFIALLGEVGSGKTFLMNMIKSDLNSNNKLIWISNIHKKKLGPNHIIDSINMALSGTHKSLSGSMEARSKKVMDALRINREGLTNYCIVIDDAHLLPEYTLRSLKQLYDLQYGFERLVGIILLGQLEMIDILSDIRLRETAQRCAIYLMQGLVQPGEIEHYLRFKISRAGGNTDKIFDKKVYSAMQKLISFEIKKGRKSYRICPILKVQNLAAHLMNEAERLNEDKVTIELLNED